MGKVLLIVLGTLVCGVTGWFIYFNQAIHAHRRETARIEAVIERGKAAPPAGLNPVFWRDVADGPRAGLLNFFIIPPHCPTEKVRAMADQFEVRWPRGARSTGDVLAMMSLMKATNPKCKRYEWFNHIRHQIRSNQRT